MTFKQFEWEKKENRKYFVHTRDNWNNYSDPDSWDIAPDTPQYLIDSFNESMEVFKKFKEMGFEV